MSALQEIRPGEPAFAQLVRNLEAADLLTSHLTEAGARYFMLVDAQGSRIGFGGLAGRGSDLLLRSVVVDPDRRRIGLGARVVAAIQKEAQIRGAQAVWLLTEGATSLFERQGWSKADRGEAPPSVAASAQFRGLCPASATLMCKRLTS